MENNGKLIEIIEKLYKKYRKQILSYRKRNQSIKNILSEKNSEQYRELDRKYKILGRILKILKFENQETDLLGNDNFCEIMASLEDKGWYFN